MMKESRTALVWRDARHTPVLDSRRSFWRMTHLDLPVVTTWNARAKRMSAFQRRRAAASLHSYLWREHGRAEDRLVQQSLTVASSIRHSRCRLRHILSRGDRMARTLTIFKSISPPTQETNSRASPDGAAMNVPENA
jgi:hypothetical protein